MHRKIRWGEKEKLSAALGGFLLKLQVEAIQATYSRSPAWVFFIYVRYQEIYDSEMQNAIQV